MTLEAGQQLIKNLALERGASVTGRVLDEFGDAEEGAIVRAYDETTGGVQAFFTTTTDDRGQYRIALLTPGVYRVSLRVRRGTTDEELFYVGAQPGRERGQVELRSGAELSGIDFRIQARAGRGVSLPSRPRK